VTSVKIPAIQGCPRRF